MKVERITDHYGEIIVMAEDNGTVNVFTRRNGFVDLIYQYGTNDSFLQVYIEALQLVGTGFFTWEGDEYGDEELKDFELDERMNEKGDKT